MTGSVNIGSTIKSLIVVLLSGGGWHCYARGPTLVPSQQVLSLASKLASHRQTWITWRMTRMRGNSHIK